MLPTTRLLSRRTFSIATRVRSMAQNPMAHHVQGYPVSHQGAKPDWGKQFRHIADAGLFYFPALGLLLGWPLIAEKFLDGHIGQL